MKKIFLASLFVSAVFSANAFADWRPVSVYSDAADTPEGILRLLTIKGRHDTQHLRDNAVNLQLAGLPVPVISRISLETTRYKWIGQSSCPAGDSRLQQSVTKHTICYKPEIPEDPEGPHRLCESMNVSMPNGDPCQ